MKYLIMTTLVLFFLLATTAAVRGEPDAPQATCTSTASANWSITTTWSCGRLPRTGDDVIIAAGHTVSVDVAATARHVTVNGALTIGITTTNRSLAARGNVTINAGGLIAPGPLTATNVLNLRGNFSNAGILDGRPTANRLLNVTFNGTTNQIITGTGVYTFNILTVNNSTATNIIDAQSVITLTGTANPLGLTRGIFKLSSNSTIRPFTSNRTLSANTGLWIANGTVTGGNLYLILNGLLRLTGGSMTIGTATSNNLRNGATGRILIEGGSLNIAGTLARSGTTSFGTLSMTNGLLNIVTVGSTSTVYPAIDISGASSAWTMSGGKIVVRRRVSHPSVDVQITPGTTTLTGGTLQIGDSATPAGQTFRVNAAALPNFLIDGTTTAKTAQLITSTLAARGSIAISATSTLNANNLNLLLTGDWLNFGTFAAGSGTVTFNNIGATQVVVGSTATAFNNLAVDDGALVVIPPTAIPTVTGTLTVNAGGALQQTRTVDNTTASFLQISGDKYRGVELTTTNNLGDVTVTIETVAPGGCTTDGVASPAYATRCYRITPTNDQSATVRLWAPTTQLNGIAEADLKVYYYDGADWQELTTNASTGHDGGNYRFAQADTPGFSDFLLGGITAPTAVTQFTLEAHSSDTHVVSVGVALFALLGLGGIVRRAQS